MRYEFFDQKLGALFGLTDDIYREHNNFSIVDWTIKFLWNRNEEPVHILIDEKPITLEPNQIITTTYLHKVNYKPSEHPITAFTRT